MPGQCGAEDGGIDNVGEDVSPGIEAAQGFEHTLAAAHVDKPVMDEGYFHEGAPQGMNSGGTPPLTRCSNCP